MIKKIIVSQIEILKQRAGQRHLGMMHGICKTLVMNTDIIQCLCNQRPVPTTITSRGCSVEYIQYPLLHRLIILRGLP